MPIEECVVRWLLGLPLLTERELATLCRVPPKSIRKAVGSLREAGWVFGLTLPASNPLGEYVLAVSDRGMTALRLNPAQAEDALGEVAWWQCSQRMVSAAVAQEYVTRTANRAVAEAAYAVSEGGSGEIAWASLLPSPSAQGELPLSSFDGELPPWVLPGHAEVRWQAGGQEAWFALYCDSGHAPTVAWERLRARWRKVRSESQIVAEAPILIVCQRDHDLEVWDALIRETSPRRSPDDLPQVGLALASDVLAPYAIDDCVWLMPRRGEWLSLADLVSWHAVDDAGALPADEDAGPPQHRQPPQVGSVASTVAARRAIEVPRPQAGKPQQTAAIVLRLSEPELGIATMLASAPWLSARDIARIEDDPEQLVERRLAILEETGLALVAPASGGPRWALRPLGRDLLAARVGFLRSPRWFANKASLHFENEAPATVPGHTAAVSRMIGLVAAAARRDGWQLASWFDERYWRRELQSGAPRPDAMVVLRGPNAERLIVLCEYELALPGRQLEERKLAPWQQWYTARRWSDERIRGALLGAPPLLLFAYGDEGRAPGSLVRAVEATPARYPICVGHEDLLAEYGLTAAVWRAAGGGTVAPLALARAAAASVRPNR